MDSCEETYDVMVVLDQAQAHRELLAGTLPCWRCSAPQGTACDLQGLPTEDRWPRAFQSRHNA